jgi:hypothetical protein
MEDPELGGDDGFDFNDLPDFASDRNKELHVALRGMEREVVALGGEYTDTVERTQTMKEHLTNVHKESVTTQQLVDARVHEIETEDHLKQLAERERGRCVGRRARSAGAHAAGAAARRSALTCVPHARLPLPARGPPSLRFSVCHSRP